MENANDFADLAAACRDRPPGAVLVLGSGLGSACQDRLKPLHSVPFGQIPGLTGSTVHGHKGCLTLGEWSGRSVLVLEGRLHFYEGHSWDMVVRPLQTAARLGARIALLTNAVGGIAEVLVPGSLMAIRDHIDWTRPWWWRHPGPGGMGPSRPAPYSGRLLAQLHAAARSAGIELHEGVYAAVTGPCYETPAEIRALRTCGADAVGMSTAREVLAGAAAGLECAAISCITNRAAGLSDQALHHQEVIDTAAAQSARLGALLEAFLDSV